MEVVTLSIWLGTDAARMLIVGEEYAPQPHLLFPLSLNV